MKQQNCESLFNKYTFYTVIDIQATKGEGMEVGILRTTETVQETIEEIAMARYIN